MATGSLGGNATRRRGGEGRNPEDTYAGTWGSIITFNLASLSKIETSTTAMTSQVEQESPHGASMIMNASNLLEFIFSTRGVKTKESMLLPSTAEISFETN